jgi:hypothetical protein
MARFVLRSVVLGALTPTHKGIKCWKEIERDEDWAVLQELAVVGASPGRQCVLQIPRGSGGRIVMRMAGPAGVGSPGHSLPETGKAFREAVIDGTNPDLVDEFALCTPRTRSEERRWNFRSRSFLSDSIFSRAVCGTPKSAKQ